MTAMPTRTPKIAGSIFQSWAASKWNRGNGFQLKDAKQSSAVPCRSWVRKLHAVVCLVDFGFIALGTGFAAALFPGPAAGYGCAVLATLWLACLILCRSTDPQVLGSGSDEYKRVMTASLVSFGVVSMIAAAPVPDLEDGFFVYSYGAGLGGVLLGRLVLRKWLTLQRKTGRCLSRVVVLGESHDVDQALERIRSQTMGPFLVVGTAIVSKQTGRVDISDSQEPTVISDVRSLDPLLKSSAPDAVMVTGGFPGSSEFIRDLAWSLEKTGKSLILASGLTEVAASRIKAHPTAGLPLFQVQLPRYRGCKHVVKRVVDVVLSGCALVILTPVFAALAWLIIQDSPGPAIFRQERVGLGERTFMMYKFRSMVETAESELAGLLGCNEGAGLLFKLRNDPRVTGVGQWLRRLSLDELPQLWNVLKGDMSLVGPRPPLPSEVAEYEEALHRRLYVKPGLTGLWQVNGRSDLSWKESIRLDLYYVENWSLAGDLLIMLQTIKVLLKPHGAY